MSMFTPISSSRSLKPRASLASLTSVKATGSRAERRETHNAIDATGARDPRRHAIDATSGERPTATPSSWRRVDGMEVIRDAPRRRIQTPIRTVLGEHDARQTEQLRAAVGRALGLRLELGQRQPLVSHEFGDARDEADAVGAGHIESRGEGGRFHATLGLVRADRVAGHRALHGARQCRVLVRAGLDQHRHGEDGPDAKRRALDDVPIVLGDGARHGGDEAAAVRADDAHDELGQGASCRQGREGAEGAGCEHFCYLRAQRSSCSSMDAALPIEDLG